MFWDFFYRLEELLVIVGLPVCPARWLFLYGPDRDIGGRGIRALGIGVRISESVENVLRRGLGLGLGGDLDFLLGNKAGPVRFLSNTLRGANTLVVEMASLHATVAAHDIGAADLTPEITDVVTTTYLSGLSRILADLAKCGLLGLLLVDTTGHSAGCWLMMMITESVIFIIQISKKKTFNFIHSSDSGKIKN